MKTAILWAVKVGELHDTNLLVVADTFSVLDAAIEKIGKERGKKLTVQNIERRGTVDYIPRMILPHVEPSKKP